MRAQAPNKMKRNERIIWVLGGKSHESQDSRKLYEQGKSSVRPRNEEHERNSSVADDSRDARVTAVSREEKYNNSR